MLPKEPTRHQILSRLSYSQNTPSFLLKLQNRIKGIPDEEEEDEGFEGGVSSRPPIPRRPAIPERPIDDPGSADEDAGDEKPQVVVLREGKHLTEREAENVRRNERGLPALPDSVQVVSNQEREKSTPMNSDAKTETPSLSFSSSRDGIKSAAKRKAVGGPENDKNDGRRKDGAKKAKKTSKTLLSFGDDA